MLVFSYNILIHDPKFYHLIPEPLIFPRIWREVSADLNNQPGHYEFFYISVTKHYLLDRKDQPCVMKKTGCNVPCEYKVSIFMA